ncbi:ABC transporter substrate-binding protein [Streptomyces sannanensis]|uniref:ABC transporter substrate-binding protein n=1 Tax=Streptomyces sannanensis TaxID=285536 RepID=A0ABP6SBL7_9ACTN
MGSRDTLTVMTWAPEGTNATNKPGMPALAEAYGRWANANGGIDGHELRVITCNERNTPVGAATCARQAVDEKAVAVVGSYSQYGRSFMAPLEAAGIPYIGGYGLSDEEFTSSLSYPVNGGQVALMAGSGKQLARNCAAVALVRPDSVAGDALPTLLDSGLKEAGREPALDIKAPEDAGDYTSQADRALDHAGSAGSDAEGCVSAVLGERTETFVDSFRRLKDRNEADNVHVASILGSVDQSLVNRTGGANGPFEGAYVTGWYPDSGDPRWDGMHELIREHAFGDNRIDPADVGVQTTYIAYTVLKAAIEAVDSDEIDARALAKALDNGPGVSTGGLTPTLRWHMKDLLGVPQFPRMVNPGVTFQVVRNGKLVSDTMEAVDVTDTLTNSSVD